MHLLSSMLISQSFILCVSSWENKCRLDSHLVHSDPSHDYPNIRNAYERFVLYSTWVSSVANEVKLCEHRQRS
jgi:hypothetical protein